MSPKNQNKNRTRKNANSIANKMTIARLPTQRTQVVLSLSGSLGSDGAGKLAGAFTMDPSSTDKWSKYNSIYDCFRVVGGRLDLASVVPFNSGSNNSIAIFAFDNDSSGTPTAYSDVTAYSEMTRMPVCWTTGAIRSVYFKRPTLKGVPQATTTLWLDEQTPSGSLGSLKFYADGLSNSITYWHYVIEYLVEFMYRS
jgi:hypothetical protein